MGQRRMKRVQVRSKKKEESAAMMKQPKGLISVRSTSKGFVQYYCTVEAIEAPFSFWTLLTLRYSVKTRTGLELRRRELREALCARNQRNVCGQVCGHATLL